VLPRRLTEERLYTETGSGVYAGSFSWLESPQLQSQRIQIFVIQLRVARYIWTGSNTRDNSCLCSSADHRSKQCCRLSTSFITSELILDGDWPGIIVHEV
jgi:hypothetical protein